MKPGFQLFSFTLEKGDSPFNHPLLNNPFRIFTLFESWRHFSHNLIDSSVKCIVLLFNLQEKLVEILIHHGWTTNPDSAQVWWLSLNLLGHVLVSPFDGLLITESWSVLENLIGGRLAMIVKVLAKLMSYGLWLSWEGNIEYEFKVFAIKLGIFLWRDFSKSLSS